MRPTFVLSLDTELFWGSFDRMSHDAFAAAHPDLRGVIRDLVSLIDEYEISATWAVVGHLFLASCSREPDGRAHPEITRPRYRWYSGDWLREDPCTTRESDGLWYGDDIVDLILAARVAQEVGSHSFSHLIYGDPGCSVAAATADLVACIELAAARGLALRSFVFPRNLEGHHHVLARHGIVAYRGLDPTWFRFLPGSTGRVAHLLDQSAALTPPVSLPYQTVPGLWNIPGSMLLLHRDGVRRFIPFRVRAAKAKAGIRRAVREGKVFHLWTHPENLASDRVGMFDTLRSTFDEAAELRARGLLDIRSMGEIAKALDASSEAGGP